jgi:hypothetical protein
MTIFRPVTPETISPILPKLLSLVFGHWKVQPTIKLEKDDLWFPGEDSGVAITVTHPEETASCGHEITDLVAAFIDGYLTAEPEKIEWEIAVNGTGKRNWFLICRKQQPKYYRNKKDNIVRFTKEGAKRKAAKLNKG